MGSEYLLYKHVLQRICSPATEPEAEIQGLSTRNWQIENTKKKTIDMSKLTEQGEVL